MKCINKIYFRILESIDKRTSGIFNENLCQNNEVIYLSTKNLDNFNLLTEKEFLKKSKINQCNSFIKLRIITNETIKINYYNTNLIIKSKEEKSQFKEINFFGLLLRASNYFLKPNYNLIIHIHGGGFYSQTSESHLKYLNEWALNTNSVIISFDYKITDSNDYTLIFDQCISAYDIITAHSAKIFNFNINKLIIYSDSVGSLIALDIIKNTIKNNSRVPDAIALVNPIIKLLTEDLFQLLSDPLNLLQIEEDSDISKIKRMIGISNLINNKNRLNYLLTDPYILDRFPQTLILSPYNEPIYSSCIELYELLKYYYYIILEILQLM